MRHDLRSGVVPSIAVEPAIAEFVEEGEKLIILFDRDGVVFVIVALGAGHRKAEKDFTGGLDPVGGVVRKILLGDSAAFVGDHVVAVESGRDLLRLGRIGEEIPGDLLDGEPVEGLIRVVGLDDPVAPEPHVAPAVDGVTVRVGVAGLIEPGEGHALSVVRRGQEPGDGLLPGVFSTSSVFGDKIGDLFHRRRQAGEVEMESPDQSSRIGFGRGTHPFLFETGENEAIDLIFPPLPRRDGLSRLHGSHVGPVAFVFGAFFDPAFQQCLLFIG